MDFKDWFKALTGNAPFPWQEKLYQQFISDRPDNIPASCNLPTGLGKTSVVAIWLIALAQQPDRIPRRLVYVVNRRTVVDQTTVEVEKYRFRLQDHGRLKSLREKLAELCGSVLGDDGNPRKDYFGEPICPLALSTLRGQFADNREWSADPSRAAVIVGTVDMIGSRLLFSGYGVGFKGRPLHAGFLGQDVLLVHDEAHLEPAFQLLLESIQREQKTEPTPFGIQRRMKVMALTATARTTESLSNETEELFELTPAEKTPQPLPTKLTEPIHVVWQRLMARKRIAFHNPSGEKESVADRVGKLAKAYADNNSGKAIVVFVSSLDDHAKVCKVLTGNQVQVLTGTLRGLERDAIMDPRKESGCPIFSRFLKAPRPDADDTEQWKVVSTPGTVFLVCTSAGEVGIDISADHLVCDLAAFDRMAQRFGRVNRYGTGDANIDIVYESTPDMKKKDDPLERARWGTLELLKELPLIDGRHSASPFELMQLRKRTDLTTKFDLAYSPIPTILPASDILFDAWALTTIRDNLPGRPSVEPYLHGISEWTPPETQVAWREEVSELPWTYATEEDRQQLQPIERRQLGLLASELLDDYPLKPHELLRDNSDRSFKQLSAIAERCPDLLAWLLDDDGSVEPIELKQLTDKDRKEQIYNRTILLPPQAGGLLIEKGKSCGLLVGSSSYAPESHDLYDVADLWSDKEGQRRIRLWENEDRPPDMHLRLVRTLTIGRKNDDADAEGRKWYWFERQDAGDSDGSKASEIPVGWQHHTNDVTQNAQRIAAKLPLSDELREAVGIAAKFHDLGKLRTIWQRDIGNDNYPACKLAKSGGKLKLRNLGNPYRHEFGSLVDLLDPRQPHFAEFKKLSADMQEVVLHLIAVHHGFGRPHFPADYVFDPEPKGANVEQLAIEIPQRFARLQRKYGRWGLAYLESLLRAADYAASANPTLAELVVEEML